MVKGVAHIFLIITPNQFEIGFKKNVGSGFRGSEQGALSSLLMQSLNQVLNCLGGGGVGG